VDGSDSARDAVRWAAREASRRNLPLHLIHVLEVPPAYGPEPVVHLELYLDAAREDGRRVLNEAAAIARSVAGEVRVTSGVADGPAAKTLIDASAASRLLVLGSRGIGGFVGLLLGSVAAAVALHAQCPVIVLHSADATPVPMTGPILVGVDGSEASDDAVEFAFEMASQHDAPLIALHTWLDVSMAGAWTALPMSVDWEAVE